MINVDMFKRIQDIIIANPERHNQSYFEMGGVGCGTTRCVAGWAIHLWGQDNGIAGTIGDIEEEYIAEVGAEDLIEAQDIDVPDYLGNGERADWIDTEHVGAHILGLDEDQSYGLFFNMDDDDALRMVKEYAQGSTNVQRHRQYTEED